MIKINKEFKNVLKNMIKTAEFDLKLNIYAQFNRSQFGCDISLFLAQDFQIFDRKIIKLFPVEDIEIKLNSAKLDVVYERIQEVYGITEDEMEERTDLWCDLSKEQIEEKAWDVLLKELENKIDKIEYIIYKDIDINNINIYYEKEIIGKIYR